MKSSKPWTEDELLRDDHAGPLLRRALANLALRRQGRGPDSKPYDDAAFVSSTFAHPIADPVGYAAHRVAKARGVTDAPARLASLVGPPNPYARGLAKIGTYYEGRRRKRVPESILDDATRGRLLKLRRARRKLWRAVNLGRRYLGKVLVSQARDGTHGIARRDRQRLEIGDPFVRGDHSHPIHRRAWIVGCQPCTALRTRALLIARRRVMAVQLLGERCAGCRRHIDGFASHDGRALGASIVLKPHVLPIKAKAQEILQWKEEDMRAELLSRWTLACRTRECRAAVAEGRVLSDVRP